VAEVVWSRAALADLRRIIAYIHEFRPLAAQRMAIRLRSAGDSLATAEDRGRSISLGRRELTVAAPYLIRYRVVGDRVSILEVRHGARRPD
jgi:toxin ParE1/3/4